MEGKSRAKEHPRANVRVLGLGGLRGRTGLREQAKGEGSLGIAPLVPVLREKGEVPGAWNNK